MKPYTINFDAVTTKGEKVDNLTLKISLPDNGCTSKKPQVLHRLCVEFARLCNISCSYANINSIEEAR